MNWIRFGLTVLAAGIGSSLSDWLFMGTLFHEKYKMSAEVWRRPEGGPGESRAVALATVLGFITCAAFAYTCARFGHHTYSTTLKLAIAVWLIAPLPMILTNALWIKLHPLLAVSHSAGWLAKLAIAALAVGLLLR